MLDILILDEIGKNISGAGMDTKVVNRGVERRVQSVARHPRFERIFVRDLSELTYNSARRAWAWPTWSPTGW